MEAQPEIHLFLIWSKGLPARDQVAADIAQHFTCLETVAVSWSAGRFSENLSRFYGENLPKNSSKEKHCGTGTFLCFVVRDEKPRYELRETSKGIKPVNINLFDAKQRYREWTGGGHRIHGTDNVREAQNNLYMLFGVPYQRFLEAKGSILPDAWDADLIGSDGWDSLDAMFAAFNELANYVVLRNFRDIQTELENLHPDIDLLTDNKRLIVDIANGKPTTGKKYRVQYRTLVGGKQVFLDVRHVGDGYYDARWERDLLDTRVGYENLYVPDGEAHFYSLMYHAYYHKEQLSRDYIEKLMALAPAASLTYTLRSFLHNNVLSDLDAYMARKGYRYSEPADTTVFLNAKAMEPYARLGYSPLRRRYERKRSLKKLVKKVLVKLGLMTAG